MKPGVKDVLSLNCFYFPNDPHFLTDLVRTSRSGLENPSGVVAPSLSGKRGRRTQVQERTASRDKNTDPGI